MDKRENREDSTWERLRDNNKGILLEIEEIVIISVLKENADKYLWSIRGYSSSVIEKREQCRKRELEKSVFIIRSIVDIFSAQIKKNQPYNIYILVTFSPTIFFLKNMKKKIKETWFKLQTQVVHNPNKLLYFKTVYIDKYKYYVLVIKSN